MDNQQTARANGPSITAVIPAYNEAGRIGNTIRSVAPFVTEVLVVDDGSRDSTAAEAEAAGARVVRQAVNQGQISAIKRGFAEAHGAIVVTVDADGEFPAEAIPDLVAPILAGRADMTQGSRNFTPRISERFLNWLANLRAPVGDSGTGFRALRTDLARRLHLRGACICGIFALEVICRNCTVLDVSVRLQTTDKPRRVAWYHIRQFFYLLPWLFRRRCTD